MEVPGERRYPSNESYTVACICPMGVELAAVEAMLDEIYPETFSDKNSYTLGRMGAHDIVIAVMPEIGNNVATTVATQLLNDFKSIRFGLLVGIGGGIPVEDEYDIRLGDVVVSKSTGTFGGVVQFDRGKILSGGTFERTGSLNKPPAVISANVQKLQARHRREGNKLSKYLEDMLVRYPNMEEDGEYFYQGSEHDQLFQATYDHQEGYTCRSCDQNRVIYREPRRNTLPRIHYGNIGSSNQVLKDAITRDKLQKDLGVICVEMEAAGLMDQFPCLVIRGICDYADSHKNKRWQSYAAATAAAYAKELLSIIPAKEIDAEKQAVEAFQISREQEQDRLLDTLPYAKDATYNSRLWEHSDRCLPDTRVELRKQILEWAEKSESPPIFWLNGMAGTGKSTIARTIAEEFGNKGQLAASFFFSRGGGNLSHAGEFVTTVAVQLTNRSKLLKEHICKAVEADRNIASQSLRTQWKQLVSLPVSNLDRNTRRPFLFVVDALDECDEDNDIILLLQLFTEVEGIRVFVTSRPETPIRLGFRKMKEILHRDLALHEISRITVDQDISTFFRDRFKKITENSELVPIGWPGEDKIVTLVRNAGGLFIYAATICRFIFTQSNQWPPQGLLEVFLSQHQNEPGLKLNYDAPSTSPTKELDAIYSQILCHSLKDVLEDDDRKALAARFRKVVGTIITLSEPLSAVALGRLLGVSQEEILCSLNRLRSVLNVPKDYHSDIRLLHPSFRDFLLDGKRCSDPLFWIDGKIAHQQLAARCIDVLSSSETGLKRDICDIQHPGTPTEDIGPSLVAKNIPAEMQYACQYYAQHLELGEEYQCDGSRVHCFLRQHLLYWLEALSLLGKAFQAVYAVTSLKSMVDTTRGANLSAFLRSTHRFILYNLSTIKRFPLQLYCSALIFTDPQNLICRNFADEKQHWVKFAVTKYKPTRLIQRFDVTNVQARRMQDPMPLLFSPTGKMVALLVGFEPIIIIWDATTGAVLHQLHVGIGESCWSTIAFSADSKNMVFVGKLTGGKSIFIEVYNVVTGTIIVPRRELFESLTRTHGTAIDRVREISVSAGGKVMALLSWNRDIYLYNIEAGSFPLIIKRYSATEGLSYEPITISADDKMVASTVRSHTNEAHFMGVVVWDTVNGTIIRLLSCEGGCLERKWIEIHCFLCFSSNGGKLLLAFDRHIWLWDATTGAALVKILGDVDAISALSFSPDGKIVAFERAGLRIELWDIEMDTLLEVYDKRGERLSLEAGLAFSPDSKVLALWLNEKRTVWLWDIPAIEATEYGGAEEEVTHKSYVKRVIISTHGTMIASVGLFDETVRLWDAESGSALHVHQFKEGVKAITFSPDNEAIAYIPMTSTGSCVLLAIDGTFRKLWEVEGAKSLNFSPNGKMIALASWSGTISLLDRATGKQLQTFEAPDVVHHRFRRISERPTRIKFSPNNEMLVLGLPERGADTVNIHNMTDTNTISLWDTTTGKCLGIHHDGDVGSLGLVAISPDNQLIVWELYLRREYSYGLKFLEKLPRSKLMIWDRKRGDVRRPIVWMSGHRLLRLSFTVDKDQHTSDENSESGSEIPRDETAEIQLSKTSRALINTETLQVFKSTPLGLRDTKDGNWIVKDDKDYILIPPSYRLSCFDVDLRHRTLALGTESGEITIIRLN